LELPVRERRRFLIRDFVRSIMLNRGRGKVLADDEDCYPVRGCG
jgi:hypothetical protein